MTTLMYVSCFIGVILLGCYIASSRKERTVRALFFKSFVSVCYLLAGAFAILSNPDAVLYGIPVLIAGVLGLKGDIYLDLKWIYEQHKADYLKIGFICFGLGHFFYIWALQQRIDLSPVQQLIPIIFGIFVVILNIVMEKPTGQNFGIFKGYLLAYAFVLSYTTALTVLIFVKTGEIYSLLFALGGVSFMASDLVLSQMYFAEGKNNFTRFTINIITYYIAQFLIAVTPAFVR